MNFKQWLETDVAKTDSASADIDAKRAIEKIGLDVQKAVDQGADVDKVVASAGKDAAKEITANAAKSGGNLSALGKVAQGIQGVQKITGTSPKPMMMKKKMKKQ